MPFGNLGTIWSEFGLDIRKLDQGLMAANLKLAGADKTITSWGQKLTNSSTKLITVGGLMAAAVAGVGIATVKMAADFEKSMRNVNSISNLSEKQFKKQADEVLSLSTRVPQSAKILADGLYDIASSGFAGAEGMKVLEASAKAASAGLTTTANSAKGITAVLNAYALSADEAGKVSDTMFKTVDKGVITFEELSNTVGDFVGMGKIANLSFDELSGALAYMTTKGLDASVAGTSLNRVILSLIDPSEEMATALKNAGYESGEVALQQLGLVGVMDLLSKSAGGSLTELQKLFPEMRALRGASALLSSGIDDLTGYMGDFKDTAGATNIALKEQSKSLDFQMQILKNNISAVAIAVGSEIIPSITKYTTKLSEYISKNKEAIADNIMLAGKIGGVTAAVLILLAAYGKLYTLWKTHPIAAIIAAYALLNTVISAGASKIEESESWWAKFGASLLRSIVPINAATNEAKKSLSVWDAYNKGLISWEEARQATITKSTKLIEERLAKEEELTNGIYDSLEAFKSAQIYIKNYSDELPNATNEMAWLIQQLQNGELSTEAFTLAIEELRKATDNGKKDIEASNIVYDQFTDLQELARIKVEAHSKAQEEAKGIIDETTGGIDEQADAVDDLRSAFNQLINDIFGGITTYNDFQEAGWAVEEAQKAIAEAEKELEKAQKATGGTFTANNEALQAYLSTNVEYLKNSAKANELQEKINKLIADGKGETSAYYSAVESLGKVQANLNEIIAEGTKKTGTYNSTGQQTEKQLVATAEATRNLEQAQNDLDDAMIANIETAFKLSTEIGATTEQQEEAKKKAIELGLQYVETGDLSIEKFIEMAYQFGLSSADIIKYADEMNIKLDYATRLRFLTADSTQLHSTVKAAIESMNLLHDKKVTITADYVRNYFTYGSEFSTSMGGIVGYAGGGIIGNQSIPTASSGMVVPQTGRSYIIKAEQDETIFNSSQQRNLAEWIMGKANSKPDSNQGSKVPIEIRIPIELDGRVIGESVSKFIYDGTKTKQIGVGV